MNEGKEISNGFANFGKIDLLSLLRIHRSGNGSLKLSEKLEKGHYSCKRSHEKNIRQRIFYFNLNKIETKRYTIEVLPFSNNFFSESIAWVEFQIKKIRTFKFQ